MSTENTVDEPKSFEIYIYLLVMKCFQYNEVIYLTCLYNVWYINTMAKNSKYVKKTIEKI